MITFNKAFAFTILATTAIPAPLQALEQGQSAKMKTVKSQHAGETTRGGITQFDKSIPRVGAGLMVAFGATGAALCGAMSGVVAYVAYTGEVERLDDSPSDGLDRLRMGFGAGLCGLVAAVFLAASASNIRVIHNRNNPMIVLNSKGFRLDGYQAVRWSRVQSIASKDVKVGQGIDLGWGEIGTKDYSFVEVTIDGQLEYVGSRFSPLASPQLDTYLMVYEGDEMRVAELRGTGWGTRYNSKKDITTITMPQEWFKTPLEHVQEVIETYWDTANGQGDDEATL